jgi:hypothetical protein
MIVVRTFFMPECRVASAEHGLWEIDDRVVEAHDRQIPILKRGFGTFRVRSDAVRIGPGSAEHRMFEMRNSDPITDTFRVLVTQETPVEHSLKIRYGAW